MQHCLQAGTLMGAPHILDLQGEVGELHLWGEAAPLKGTPLLSGVTLSCRPSHPGKIQTTQHPGAVLIPSYSALIHMCFYICAHVSTYMCTHSYTDICADTNKVYGICTPHMHIYKH